MISEWEYLCGGDIFNLMSLSLCRVLLEQWSWHASDILVMHKSGYFDQFLLITLQFKVKNFIEFCF